MVKDASFCRIIFSVRLLTSVRWNTKIRIMTRESDGWTLVFYTDEQGGSPVEEFLRQLVRKQ
jgi:hypothetical protein